MPGSISRAVRFLKYVRTLIFNCVLKCLMSKTLKIRNKEEIKKK
jgi:hypothetical protein